MEHFEKRIHEEICETKERIERVQFSLNPDKEFSPFFPLSLLISKRA
jgi:hypothetical protein